MEIDNKIIIDSEQYDSLLKMLNAGAEDKQLAFACIAKLSGPKNWVPIALLRAESNTTMDEWLAYCNDQIRHQISIGLNCHEKLHFYHISTAISKYAYNNKDAIQLFIERYEKFVEDIIKRVDFIGDAQVRIRAKYNDSYEK